MMIEQGSFGRGTCFIGLTLRDFVSLLKALVEAEVSYEALKESKKHQAATIFEQLDPKKKGQVNKADIRDFLQRQYFYASE